MHGNALQWGGACSDTQHNWRGRGRRMACVGAPLKPGVIEYRGQEPSAFKTKVDRQGVEQMLSLMSVGLQVCTRGALLCKKHH